MAIFSADLHHTEVASGGARGIAVGENSTGRLGAGVAAISPGDSCGKALFKRYARQVIGGPGPEMVLIFFLGSSGRPVRGVHDV